MNQFNSTKIVTPRPPSETAQEYKRRGYCPIPVLPQSKKVILPDWKNAKFTEEEIKKVFLSDSNVGIILGEPSNHLVDIDIDCDLGLGITHLLPPTGSVFGRKSRPNSHMFYHCKTKTKKFTCPISTEKTTIVEIRSTGCQTVAPGSVHESGELVEWECDLDPFELDEKQLLTSITVFASACLLARHWPEGSRHDTTLSLAGALIHSDWRAKDVINFVDAVIIAAGDEEIEDRRKAVQDTIKNFESGNNVTGWPTLSNHFHEKVLAKIQEWLNIDDSFKDQNDLDNEDESTSDLLFELKEARVNFYLKNVAPPIKVLFKDFPIPSQKPCGLVATGGVGKSFLNLQIGVSLASGTPLCNIWRPAMLGKILILCAEDDEDEIHRRIKAITSHIKKRLSSGDIAKSMGNGITEEELELRLCENLYIKSLVGADNLLTRGKNKEVEQTVVLDKLINTANQIDDLLLIVVDPISRFRGGDENSAEDVTQFIVALDRIVKETDATVLAAHHANKESQKIGAGSEQFSTRGSSAFTDGIRFQMNMVTMDSRMAKKLKINSEDRRSFVNVSIPKSNYSKPFPDTWLKRADGGVLEHFRFTSESDLEDEDKLPKVIAKIKERSDAGYEYSKSKFSKDFGGLKRELGISRDKIDRLIDIGMEKGLLGLRDPENKKRNNRNGVLFVVEKQENT